MKITVITVCFNSSDTIEKTIKSVITQNYQDKEYIIVDGGSTDGTTDIIRKYDKYISRWVSEADQGIFDAMNKGIGMATGDVIAFLNSDDWYLDSALSLVHEAFMEQECDCVCCDNYVITWDGSSVYYDASDMKIDDMYKKMIYYHSAIFARRHLFEKNNNFDLNYKIAADYDWMLRVMNKGAELYYLHKPVFTFRYGGISSVNQIECAGEAREIAIRHLPAHKNDYLKEINARYCHIAVCASDKEWLAHSFKKTVRNGMPVILWGAGCRGEQCLGWLQKADIPVLAVIDKDAAKWGKVMRGVPIHPPRFLNNRVCNVIITPEKYETELREEVSMIDGELSVYLLKDLEEKMVEAGRTE